MITKAWAKISPAGFALSVEDHGADVAAVLHVLMSSECFGRELETTAQRSLTSLDMERLCFLAFLHDMGKCNYGFWRRQFPKASFIGHTNELASLFQLGGVPALDALSDVLEFEWQGNAHFCAVLAHHGRPLPFLSSANSDPKLIDEPWLNKEFARLWSVQDNYDPVANLNEVLTVAKTTFPGAFRDGPPLPQQQRFVSLFAGLVTLADWIGSDRARFPEDGPTDKARWAFALGAAQDAIRDLGLARRNWGDAGPETLFGFSLHPAQSRTGDGELGQIVTLEIGTGSGKTEAALWRFFNLARAGKVDGLYFALPTRTAATQLHNRLTKIFDRLDGEDTIEPVLAVPGYIRAGQSDGQMLAPFEVLWPDDAKGQGDRWAAESPKRYLAARIAVGTVDQAMLAGVQVKHAHLRAAALSRTLLVVDEVHASDPYMSVLLKTVIDNHVGAGGQVLLLSATLGGELRARLTGVPEPDLEQAENVPYPAISSNLLEPEAVDAKQDKVPVMLSLKGWMSRPEQIAAKAVDAARHGASTLVLRNRVDDAVAVARAVETLGGAGFSLNGIDTLHHGRFATEDRRRLDLHVEEVFGKTGTARTPLVLCGTQTLEQSLDIDADFLITDLAPMDVLLQRLGRLHRHERQRPQGFEAPRALVLTPADRDLRALQERSQHGLGPFTDETGIYPDLTVIEATWSLLEERGSIAIPDDSRRLVERAVHSEARAKAARRAGLEQTLFNQQGRVFQEMQQALRARLVMNIPFQELLFLDALDGVVSTRLGARDVIIELPTSPIGPFGTPVSRLKIPAWMAGEITAEDVPELTPLGDGFEMSLGARRFVYDRFGLQKG